ncbi:MAG: quinone-dependent dihydroorotate dehydrogenase [Alphaproteobacteria bacterium]|nr:quinone-dependent dihydroorotate dehydrogenase [Alphaproteobacteria bacterium]
MPGPGVYRMLTRLLHFLPPEAAHRAAVLALKYRIAPIYSAADDPVLATTVAGMKFTNPLGMAAGFDKNAEAITGTLALGFGFTEAGTVTPRAQPGNPRPRVFRVPEARAVINRYGFNGNGLDYFVARLKKFRARNRKPRGLVGVNVGKNKDSPEGSADFVACVKAGAALADYLVVNVSSPNTPGLRGLQNKQALAQLLWDVKRARDACPALPPLFVKLAPDLTPEMLEDIAGVTKQSGIDGIIVTNTTIDRPASLPAWAQAEAGGLSGAPLKDMALDVLRRLYRLTEGRTPLIGVGGIENGADAYARIRAGASLVQVYTALIYEGPGLAARIKRELAALLKRDGFASVAAARGADAGR